MKKHLLLFFLAIPLLSFSQSYHSWDGNGISPNSKFRVLNIFINVIYDVHQDTNIVESDFWPRVTDTLQEGVNVSGTIPNHLLNFMDTAYIPGQLHGTITRIFGESSFDSLQIAGDFIVVNVREKRVLDRFHSFQCNNIAKAAVEVINNKGFHTVYGHDDISYYDYLNNGKFYFTQVVFRNISDSYGNLGACCGHSPCSLGGDSIVINGVWHSLSSLGTIQNEGGVDFSLNPTSVMTHEISHNLFGDNNFHTSGGNHRGSGSNTMPSMTIQGGFGLMGGSNSGLVSCNGYERWRMHWKHPSSPYYIGARNIVNSGFVNSDISKEDGNKWFVLRDFVTYGDAVRIKLPYKDSTITPNQYIWLEFHNVGHNNKLDFLQFTNDSSTCLHHGASGIYAYYQIGRDVLESENKDSIWDDVNRDNLRIISNEGFWDYVQYTLPDSTDFVCTGWNRDTFYYVPEYSNAFCGYQDQENMIMPKGYDTNLASTCDTFYITPFRDDNHNYTLEYKIREYTAHNMIKNGAMITHSIPNLGDSLDAFSTHRKINMGTNPSTCNAKTCYTYNLSAQKHLLFDKNTQYNNTTTYLTGLSIEMTPISNGDRWRVLVRWDDYDITDDARWTGRIVLKGSEQVNLTGGHSITLAQNRTPAQQFRSIESGYFAEPTELTCEAGSHFTQQPHSTLLLTEKSRFVLDSAAAYHLGDSAQILVQGGSTFTISKGADFTGGIVSEIIVDSLSILYVYDTAKLRREARIIVRPGGKLIVNGGTLTNACDGEMWQGIFVEGNTNLRQGALAQGSVILTNATIENARDAICTRKAGSDPYIEHAGGIIQATNTLFRNNRRSVEFLSYENHTTGGAVTDNASYFTRCTFTVDNDNLFADNGTSFLEHVSMWEVRGVKFNGCAFRNETGSHSGKAIYTIAAGFTARRVCPMPTVEPCVCNNYGGDTVRRCLFVGFDTAVHATNTEGSYLVTLDNCDFAGNYVGVELAAADNARVSFCDFDLDYTSNANTGVYLKNSTGYTVESNGFHRTHYSALTSVGVCADSSGTAENVIRLNDFAKLTYGCYAWNCNAVIGIKTRGLQYVCNSYDSCKYSIYVRSAAKIRTAQGSPSVGADNSFYNNISMGRSITIPSDHTNVSYYYYDSGNHAPVGTSNYTPHLSTNANSCTSTLCGGGMVNPKGTLALSQYAALADEYAALAVEYEGRESETDEEASSLLDQMSDLSAQMGDLARAEIRNILNDSVPGMALLKEWYSAITAAAPATGDIPVAAYQLAEVYSEEGNLSAARTLLSALPQQFNPDEAARSEYANYMALQQLRETVAGNWYLMTDSDIAAMRQVAEYDNGRAARMAKEILCFFHHICYEDDPLWDLDGIGERNLGGDVVHRVPTTTVADGLVVYPNPTGGILTVESSSPIREITVYDLSGRVMMTVGCGVAVVETCCSASLQQPYTVNVSSLHSGIYLLKAVTDSGVQTARFVKN